MLTLLQLNFTAMLRPSKREIDAIETLGNKGWNWDSILHYMKKVGSIAPAIILCEG